MIEREELKRYAKKRELNLWMAEKEYLLKLFLYLYYSKYDNAAFKGGTAFRFFDGLDRFSEDLDFFVKDSNKFKNEILRTVERYTEYGIDTEIEKVETFEASVTLKLKLKGPLYNGNPRSISRIHIDAGYRLGIIKGFEYRTLDPQFIDIPPFIVKLMTRDERFAEKVAALISRGKPRDWYDVFFYKDIIPIDIKLIKSKIPKGAKYKRIDPRKMKAEIQPLIRKKLDFQVVVEQTEKYLKEIGVI